MEWKGPSTRIIFLSTWGRVHQVGFVEIDRSLGDRCKNGLGSSLVAVAVISPPERSHETDLHSSVTGDEEWNELRITYKYIVVYFLLRRAFICPFLRLFIYFRQFREIFQNHIVSPG